MNLDNNHLRVRNLRRDYRTLLHKKNILLVSQSRFSFSLFAEKLKRETFTHSTLNLPNCGAASALTINTKNVIKNFILKIFNFK